eukprot:6863134-Heterocapsa_arctica.AAC.1
MGVGCGILHCLRARRAARTGQVGQAASQNIYVAISKRSGGRPSRAVREGVAEPYPSLRDDGWKIDTA